MKFKFDWSVMTSTEKLQQFMTDDTHLKIVTKLLFEQHDINDIIAKKEQYAEENCECIEESIDFIVRRLSRMKVHPDWLQALKAIQVRLQANETVPISEIAALAADYQPQASPGQERALYCAVKLLHSDIRGAVHAAQIVKTLRAQARG